MSIITFPIKIINWLLNYTVLLIINFFYPIKELLFNKYIQYSTNNIKEEDKNIINQTINDFTLNLNIDILYKDDFNKLIKSLSKYEKIYVKDIKTNELCYLQIRYVFKILELAQEAILKLNEVDSDNRKVSYYENIIYG